MLYGCTACRGAHEALGEGSSSQFPLLQVSSLVGEATGTAVCARQWQKKYSEAWASETDSGRGCVLTQGLPCAGANCHRLFPAYCSSGLPHGPAGTRDTKSTSLRVCKPGAARRWVGGAAMQSAHVSPPAPGHGSGAEHAPVSVLPDYVDRPRRANAQRLALRRLAVAAGRPRGVFRTFRTVVSRPVSESAGQGVLAVAHVIQRRAWHAGLRAAQQLGGQAVAVLSLCFCSTSGLLHAGGEAYYAYSRRGIARY